MDIQQALLTDIKQEINLIQSSQMQLLDVAATHFSLSATMRLDQANTEANAAFGLVLYYGQKEQFFVQFLQQEDCWSLAVESTGTYPVTNSVLPLPPSFDLTQDHTLRIEQQDQLTVSLDGVMVLAILETPRLARPGLFTREAGATFSQIHYNNQPNTIAE